MGRKLRTNLPQLQSELTPEWSYLDHYHQADKCYKERLKVDFDRRHRVSSLPELPDDSLVMVEFQDRHDSPSNR